VRLLRGIPISLGGDLEKTRGELHTDARDKEHQLKWAVEENQ